MKVWIGICFAFSFVPLDACWCCADLSHLPRVSAASNAVEPTYIPPAVTAAETFAEDKSASRRVDDDEVSDELRPAAAEPSDEESGVAARASPGKEPEYASGAFLDLVHKDDTKVYPRVFLLYPKCLNQLEGRWLLSQVDGKLSKGMPEFDCLTRTPLCYSHTWESGAEYARSVVVQCEYDEKHINLLSPLIVMYALRSVGIVVPKRLGATNHFYLHIHDCDINSTKWYLEKSFFELLFSWWKDINNLQKGTASIRHIKGFGRKTPIPVDVKMRLTSPVETVGELLVCCGNSDPDMIAVLKRYCVRMYAPDVPDVPAEELDTLGRIYRLPGVS